MTSSWPLELLLHGLKGAVHAMLDLFDEHSDNGWFSLFVDAHNAFNTISHPAL